MERDEEDLRNVLIALDKSYIRVAADANFQILKERYEKITLRRLKNDVLDELPEVKKTIHWLSLDPISLANYNHVITRMHNANPRDRIGYINRLMAAAAGTSPAGKFEACLDLISKCLSNDKKVVVFSNFNELIDQLQSLLASAKVKFYRFTGQVPEDQRWRILNRFATDANASVLIANPSIAREGLTLTEASVAIFLNEWWNPSTNRQAEDRINRIGQKNDVEIHILRARDTIDEALAKILELKFDREQEFSKSLISELLGN